LRTLQIHAKRFGYRVREKAVESAEEIRGESGEAENALVAFITVERGMGRGRLKRLGERSATMLGGLRPQQSSYTTESLTF